MAHVLFRCPHCGERLDHDIDTKIVTEDGQSTIRVKCQDGICCHCGRGMHMIFCAGVEKMSEHEVRKDAKLFRIAERMRRQLKLPI